MISRQVKKGETTTKIPGRMLSLLRASKASAGLEREREPTLRP
jgi:hypothetical protein